MNNNGERRQSPRKRFENLLYVEIEPGNGGMVLNLSEHGFGFRAVKRVRPKQELKFAFNLDEKRRAERVRSLIGSLPTVRKRAIELAYFGGFTHIEIASMLAQRGLATAAILGGALSDATRFRLAQEAFRRTAQYDAAIASYLALSESGPSAAQASARKDSL